MKNIGSRITEGLPADVINLIRIAGKAAEQAGMKTYLVGGIIRDLLLGRQSNDIDITVEGDALAVADIMSKLLKNRPIQHRKFGTATFQLGEYRLDLATCRKEMYNRPGALPSVKPGSIEEDLFRRDFTVNAMAACINIKHFGDMIDLYGGQEDLEKKLIRILHNRSFADDATRIMRAVRYEQRLGFRLERKTASLLGSNLDMLDTISSDRLRHEAILWLEETDAGKILARAARLGILAKLHPALKCDRHISKALDESSGCPGRVQLRFATLVYNLDNKQLDEFLERLNIKGGVLEEAARHTLALKDKQAAFDRKTLKPSEIYLKLKGFNLTAITANHILSPSPCMRSHLKLYLNNLRQIKTILNGEDLVQLGIPRGRRMGIIMSKLLYARLDGKVKSKEDEIRFARRLQKNSKPQGM